LPAFEHAKKNSVLAAFVSDDGKSLKSLVSIMELTRSMTTIILMNACVNLNWTPYI
jgi:hypothetical protein